MYASSESIYPSNVIPETLEVSKSHRKLSHRYLLQYQPNDYIYPWESLKTPQDSMLPQRRQITNKNYRRKFFSYPNINNQNNHQNLRKRWNLFRQKADSINSSTDRSSTTLLPQQLTTNNNYSLPQLSFTPNYDYNIKNREVPVWQTRELPDQEQALYRNYDNEQLNSPDYRAQLNNDKNPAKRGFRLLPVSKNLYVLKQDSHDELPADPVESINDNQRNIELKRSNPGVSDETSDLLSFRAHLHHDVRDIGKSFLQRPMKRDGLSSASDFIDQDMDLTNPSPDSWRSMSSGQSLEEGLPVVNNYQGHQYADPLMNSVDVNGQDLKSYENLYGPMDSSGSLQGLNSYGSQQIPVAGYQQIPNELDSAGGGPRAFDQQNFEEYNNLVENNLYDVDHLKNDAPAGHLGYLDKYARAVDSINDRWRDDQEAEEDVSASLNEGNSPEGSARDLSGSVVSRPVSPELEKVNGTSLAMVIEPLTAQLQKLLSSIQQVNEKLISQNNSVDSSRKKRGADDSGIEDESYDDVDDDEETRDERSDDDDEEDPCSSAESGDTGCERSRGFRKHVRNDERFDLNVEEVTSNFLNNSQSSQADKTTRKIEETTVINEFREHFVNPDLPNIDETVGRTTQYAFHPEEEEILETIRHDSQQSEETTRKSMIVETTPVARGKITEKLTDATLKPLDVFQGAKGHDITFSSVDDLETIKVAVEPVSDNQTSHKLLRTGSKELLMKLLPKDIIQNITADGIIVRIPGDEMRPNSVISSTSSGADQGNPVWFFEGEGNIKDPRESLNSRKSIGDSPKSNGDVEMKGNDALVAVSDDEEEAGDTKLTIKLRLPNRSHQKAVRNVELKEKSKDVEKTLAKRSQPTDDLDEESLDDYRNFDKRNVDTLGNEYVDDSDEDEGEFEDYDDDEPAENSRNEKRSGKVVNQPSGSPPNVPKIVLRLRFPESSGAISDLPKRSSPQFTQKKKRQKAVKKSPHNIEKKKRMRIGRSLKWFQDETDGSNDRIDRQIYPLDSSGTTEEASESSAIKATALREVTAYSKLVDVLTVPSISTESTETPYSIPVIFQEETEGITESASSSLDTTIASTEAPNPEISDSNTSPQMQKVTEFTTSAFFVTMESIKAVESTPENPLTSETPENLEETTTEFFPSTETSGTSEEKKVLTKAPQEGSSSEALQQIPETEGNIISTTFRAKEAEPTTPTTETTSNPPSTSQSTLLLSKTPALALISTTEALANGFTSASTELLITTTVPTTEVLENITEALATTLRSPITETESSTTELFSSLIRTETLEERESSIMTSSSIVSSTTTSSKFPTSTISTLEMQTEEVFSSSVSIPLTSETSSLSTTLGTPLNLPTTAKTTESEYSSSFGIFEGNTSEETTTIQQTSSSISKEITTSTSFATTEETVMTSLSQSTSTERSLGTTSNPTVMTEGKLGMMTIPFLTSFSLERKVTSEGHETSVFLPLNTEVSTALSTAETSTPASTMKLTAMSEEVTIPSKTSVSEEMEMLSTEKWIAATPSFESIKAPTETTPGTASVVIEGTLKAISTTAETLKTVGMIGTSEIGSTTIGMQATSERPSTTVEVIEILESTATTVAITEAITESPTILEAAETSATTPLTTVVETLELSTTTAKAEETVASTSTTTIAVVEITSITPEVIEMSESIATTAVITEAITESPTTLEATKTSGTTPPTTVVETLDLSTTTAEAEETVASTSTTTIAVAETTSITPEVIEMSESIATTAVITEAITESPATLEVTKTSGTTPPTTVVETLELSTTTAKGEETVASTSTTSVTVAETSTTTPEVLEADEVTIVEMNESLQTTLTIAKVSEGTKSFLPTTVEIEKNPESRTPTTADITTAESASTTIGKSIETSESISSTTVGTARTSESATAVETEKTEMQSEITTESTESTPSQLSKVGTEEPEDEGELYETEIETKGPTEEEDGGEQYEDVGEYDEGVTQQWEEVETSETPNYETSTKAPEERRTEEQRTSTSIASPTVFISSELLEEDSISESTITGTQRTSTESLTTAGIAENSESTATTAASIETSVTFPEVAGTKEVPIIEVAESTESTPTMTEMVETSGSILSTTVEVEETSTPTINEIIETPKSPLHMTATVKETSEWIETTVESQETPEFGSTAETAEISESTPSTTIKSTKTSESTLRTTATAKGTSEWIETTVESQETSEFGSTAETAEISESTPSTTIKSAKTLESTLRTTATVKGASEWIETTVDSQETSELRSTAETAEIPESTPSTLSMTAIVKETSEWIETTVESQETPELRSTTVEITETSESALSTTSESTGTSESMWSTTAAGRGSITTLTTAEEETTSEWSTTAVEVQKISSASSTITEVPETSTSSTTVETEITSETTSMTIAKEVSQPSMITITEVAETSEPPSTIAEIGTTIEIAETQQFTPTEEEKLSESSTSTAKFHETSTIASSTTEVSETSESSSRTTEVEVPSTSTPSTTARETSEKSASATTGAVGMSRSASVTVTERTSEFTSIIAVEVSEPSESSPTMIETSEMTSTTLTVSETSTTSPTITGTAETIESTSLSITEVEETSGTSKAIEISETLESTLETASITEISRSTTSITQAISKPTSPIVVASEETSKSASLLAETETSPMTYLSTVEEETSKSRVSTTVEVETIPESTLLITKVETSRSTFTTTEVVATVEPTLSTVVEERPESTSATTGAKSSKTTLSGAIGVEETSQSTIATTEMTSTETTISSSASSNSKSPNTEEASETIAEVSKSKTMETASVETEETSEEVFQTQTLPSRVVTTPEIAEEPSIFLITKEHTREATSTRGTFEISLITTSEESSKSSTYTLTSGRTEGEADETSGEIPTTREIVSPSESSSTVETSASEEVSITETITVTAEEATSSMGMTMTLSSPETDQEAVTEEIMSTATRIITIPEVTTSETWPESTEISESTMTAKLTEKNTKIPSSPEISKTQEPIPSAKSTEMSTETSEITEGTSELKRTSTEGTPTSLPTPTREETIPELFSETSTSETLESEESTSFASVRTIIEFTRTTIPESTLEFPAESSTQLQRTTTKRATPVPSLIPEITLMSTFTPYSTVSTAETIATEENTETELTPTALTLTFTKPEKISTFFFISSAELPKSTEGTSEFSSTFPSSLGTSTEIPTVAFTAIQKEKDYHDTSTSERTPESTTELISTIQAEINMEAVTTSTSSLSLSTTLPTAALSMEEVTILASLKEEIQPSVPTASVDVTSQLSLASTSESAFVLASTSILAETEWKAESSWTTTETTTPLLLEETEEPEIEGELYEAEVETEGPIEEENEEQYGGVGEYDEEASESWEEIIETSEIPSFGTSTETLEEQRTEEREPSPSITFSGTFSTTGLAEKEVSESTATAIAIQKISTETMTNAPGEQRTEEREINLPTISSATLLTKSISTPGSEEEIQSVALTTLAGTASEEFSTSPVISATTESAFVLTTIELQTEVPWLTTERIIPQLPGVEIGETADEGEYYETEIETEEGPPEDEEEEGEEEYEYAEEYGTGTEGLTDYFEYEDEGGTHPWKEPSTKTPEEQVTEGRATNILTTNEPPFSSRGTPEYLAESEFPLEIAGTVGETTRISKSTVELPWNSEITLNLPGTMLTSEETARTLLSFPEVTKELWSSTETVPFISTGTAESFITSEIPSEALESTSPSFGTSQTTAELLQSSEIILTFGGTAQTLGEITGTISNFSEVSGELSYSTETTPKNLASSKTTTELIVTIPELLTLGENSGITPEYLTSAGTLFELIGSSKITSKLPRTSTIISSTLPETAVELPTASLTSTESSTSREMLTKSTETVWSSSGTSEQTESVSAAGTIGMSMPSFPWKTMGPTEQLTSVITEFTGTVPEGSTNPITPFAVVEAPEGTSEVSGIILEQSTLSKASSRLSGMSEILENAESVPSSPFRVSTSPFPWETLGSTEQLTSIITEYESSSIETISELGEIGTARTTEQWTLGTTEEHDWNAESFPDFGEEYSTTGSGQQVGKAETTSESIPDITLPRILERPEENLEDYSDEYAAEYAELTEETPMIPDFRTSVLMIGSTASTPQTPENAFHTGMETLATTISYFVASPEGFHTENEISLGTEYPELSEGTEAIVPSFFITEQSFTKPEFSLETSTFQYGGLESFGTSQETYPSPSYPEGYISTGLTIEEPKFEITQSEETAFPQTHASATSILFISSGRTTSSPEASSVSILVEGTEAIPASSESLSTESAAETTEESSFIREESTTRASIDDVEEELEDQEKKQLDRRGQLEKRLRELKEREKILLDREDDLRRRQEEWEREKQRRQREREHLEEEKRRKKLTTTTTTTEVTTTTVTTTTTTTRPTTTMTTETPKITTTTTTPTTTTTTTEIPTTTVDYEKLKELEEMKKQQEELNDELARMEQEIADKEKELEDKEKRLQEEEEEHQREKEEFEKTWDEQKEEDIAEREKELEEREKKLDEKEKKLEEEKEEPEEEGSAEIETSSSGTSSSEFPSSSEEISSAFEEYSSSSTSSVTAEEIRERTSVSPERTLVTTEPEVSSTESTTFQYSTTEEEGSGDYIFDDNEDVWKEQPDANREVVDNDEYEEECETPVPTGDDFPTPIMRILENSDEGESNNNPVLEESKKSGVEYESVTKKLCLHILDENNPSAYEKSHDFVTQVICMPNPHQHHEKARTGNASRRRKLLNLEEISTIPIALVEVDVEKRSKETVHEQKRKPIASLNLMGGEWMYNDTTVALHTPQGFTRVYESWSKVPFEPFNFQEDSTKKGSLVRDETFMRKNFKVNRFDHRIQPTQVNRLSDDEWVEVPTESISRVEASEPDEDEKQSDYEEQSDADDENRKKKRKREDEDDDSGPTEYPPEYEENCMLQQHGPWRSASPDLEEPTTSKNEEYNDPVFREPETEDHVDEDVVDVDDDEESTVSPSNDEYKVQEEKDEESESDHEDSDVGQKKEEADNDHDEPGDEKDEKNPDRDEPSDEDGEIDPYHDELDDESDLRNPEEDAEPSELEQKTTREPKNHSTTKAENIKPPETTTGDYGEIEYFTDDSDPNELSDDYDEELDEPEWTDYESTGEAKKGENRKREGKVVASLEDLKETKKLLMNKKNALRRREISLKLRERVLKQQEADLQKLKEERRSKRKIQKSSKPVISWPTEGPGRYHLGGHERWEYGLLEDVRKDYKKNKQAFTVNVLRMDYDEDEENHKLKCEEPGKDDLVINEGLITKAFEDTTLGTTSSIAEGTTRNLKLVAGDDSSGMRPVDGRIARPSRRTTKPRNPPGIEWPTERTTKFHVGGTRSWDKELLGTPDDTNYKKRRARGGFSYYDDDEPQDVDEEMGTTCYTLILKGGGNDFDMGDKMKWRRDAEDQVERPEEAEEVISLKPRLRTIKSVELVEKEKSAESMASSKIQESVQHSKEKDPSFITMKFLNPRVTHVSDEAHDQSRKTKKRKDRRKKHLNRKTFSFDNNSKISVFNNPDSSNISEVQEHQHKGLGRSLFSMRKSKSPKLQKKPHTAKNKQLPKNFRKKSKNHKNQRVIKREASTSKKSREKTPLLMSKVMNIIDAPEARFKHQNKKETRSIFGKMKQMINKVIGHGNLTTIEPDINPNDDEDSDESYTEIIHPSASKFIPKDEGEPEPDEAISSFASRHKINEKPYRKKHPAHQEAKSHHHHHEHHHHTSPEHHNKQPHHHHERDHSKNNKKSHPSKPSREINQSSQKIASKIPIQKNPFPPNVRSRKKIDHPKFEKPVNISSIIPTVKNLVENQNLGNLEKIIVYVDENEGFRKKKRNLDKFSTKVAKKHLNLKNERKRSKSIGDYQSEELSFDGESLDEMISHVADKILNSVSGSSLQDLDPHLSVKVIQEVSNGSGEPREETKSEFTLDLTDPNFKNLEKSKIPRNLNLKEVSAHSRVTSPSSKRRMNLPKASGKKRRHWMNKIKRENIVEKIKNKLEMELKKKLNRKRRRVSIADNERPLPHHLDDLDEKIRILYAMHHKKESKDESSKKKRGQSKNHKRSKREDDWRLDYLESNIFANEADKKSLRALIEQIISLQKNVNTTLQIIRKKLDSPNIIVKKSQSSVLPAISNKKSKSAKVKVRSNSQKSKKTKVKEKISKKNKDKKKKSEKKEKSEKKQKMKKSKAKVTKKKLEKNYGDEQVDKIGNEIQKILEEEEGDKITRKTTKNRRKTRNLKEVAEENSDRVRIGRHLCSKTLQNHKKSGKKYGQTKSSKKRNKSVSRKSKESKKLPKPKRIERKKNEKHEGSKKIKKLSDHSQQTIRNVSVPISLRSNHSENCGGCLCDLDDTVMNLKKMLLLRNDLLDRISTYSCQKFTNIGDELVLTSSGVLGDVLPRSRRQIAEAKGLKYVRPGDLEDMLQGDEIIGHDHEILSFPGSDLNIPCNHEGEEITWIMSISRPNYTWTRIDNSPISGTIRKNGNLELYDVDAKDAGNYSCIVTYIDPDNEELVENIYEHNIKIVTLPRYTLRGGNRYKMDVCEEAELDVLSSYLPPKLNEILCKNSICDAFIFAPHCHSHQVSIRILIVPTNPSKLLPISTTQCGLRCRKAVQDKIAILLIKNLRIILRKKIVFRIQNSRKDQLVPVDNKMADFMGENGGRWRKRRGRIGRNVKGDADGEVGLLVGCPAGYGLDNSHCVPCSPHYHSQDLSARCKRCPLGTHQPSIGSRVCRTCTNPFVEGCYEMLWTTSSIFLAILASLLAVIIISCIVLWILCSRRSRKSSSIQKNEEIEMKNPLIPRLNCSQQSDDEEIIWERPRKKKKKLIKRLLKTNDNQPLVYGINLLPKNQERENNRTIPICCIDSYRSHGGHCHECKHSHYPNTGKRQNFRPPVPFPDFDR